MDALKISQNPLDSHECYIKINKDTRVSIEFDYMGEKCYGITGLGKTLLLKESTALRVIEGLNMLINNKELCKKAKGKTRIIKFNKDIRPKEWNI